MSSCALENDPSDDVVSKVMRDSDKIKDLDIEMFTK